MADHTAKLRGLLESLPQELVRYFCAGAHDLANIGTSNSVRRDLRLHIHGLVRKPCPSGRHGLGAVSSPPGRPLESPQVRRILLRVELCLPLPWHAQAGTEHVQLAKRPKPCQSRLR